MLELRKVRPEDREAIVGISKKIWDGDDYIENVVDKWTRAEKGEFTTAVYDGELAGFTKLTVLRNNCLWLEGIRVDPKFRGLGIGKALGRYQFELAERMGYKTLELATFAENYESIAIIEKSGFERIASFKYLYSEYEDMIDLDPVIDIKNFVESDVDKVQRLLDNDPALSDRMDYLNFDWTFQKRDRALIELLVERGDVYCYNDKVFILTDYLSKGKCLSIAHIGNLNETDQVLRGICRYSRERGYTMVQYMSDNRDDIYQTISDLGFKRISDETKDVYIYGKVKF